MRGNTKTLVLWALFVVIITVPIIAAAFSPQLNWRGPIYISAGFAGIVGMALLLAQPLLAGRYLPSLSPIQSRLLHRVTGGLLTLSVTWHVIGLWLTSPPDMIDALLFQSPTPFSKWGVLSMWAIFAAAVLAISRKSFRVKNKIWRRWHFGAAFIAVVGCIVHVVQIEGTMETISKIGLSIAVLLATAMLGWNIWRKR